MLYIHNIHTLMANNRKIWILIQKNLASATGKLRTGIFYGDGDHHDIKFLVLLHSVQIVLIFYTAISTFASTARNTHVEYLTQFYGVKQTVRRAKIEREATNLAFLKQVTWSIFSKETKRKQQAGKCIASSEVKSTVWHN